MQSISYVETCNAAKSSTAKRTVMVLATLLLALTINTTEVNKADSRVLKGALIGGGVGAIFGGSRGAVAGAIAGGLIGGLSKKSRKRRW